MRNFSGLDCFTSVGQQIVKAIIKLHNLIVDASGRLPETIAQMALDNTSKTSYKKNQDWNFVCTENLKLNCLKKIWKRNLARGNFINKSRFHKQKKRKSTKWIETSTNLHESIKHQIVDNCGVNERKKGKQQSTSSKSTFGTKRYSWNKEEWKSVPFLRVHIQRAWADPTPQAFTRSMSWVLASRSLSMMLTPSHIVVQWNSWEREVIGA